MTVMALVTTNRDLSSTTHMRLLESFCRWPKLSNNLCLSKRTANSLYPSVFEEHSIITDVATLECADFE